MALTTVTNFQGLNLYVNPMLQKNGSLLRAVNVDNYPYGAISKRAGYDTFLGTADSNTSAVDSLLNFTKDDGTTSYLYKAQGTLLYYYDINGTESNWTVAGNGTLSEGAGFGAAVLNNTLVGGDGAGSTRHTTNGTAFTNTTLASPARYFAQYLQRIYAAGTDSNLYFSTTGDGTNWNTSGTSDSSSLLIGGPGKMGAIFRGGGKLVATKNSGLINTWDSYIQQDLATKKGPSSPNSIGELEDFRFYLARDGIRGFGGGKPELISSPVQGFVYNKAGVGISGADFDSAAGVAHKTDYLVSVGSTTDDLMGQSLTNGVIKYDVQKNSFLTWDMADKPTAWLSYLDENRDEQLIFGSNTQSGQVYKMSTSTSDNGSPIYSIIEGAIPLGGLTNEADLLWVYALMNPGNQAKLQVAVSNTFRAGGLKWIDLGDCSSGVVNFRCPPNQRGKFLFYRVTDSSSTSSWTLYGLGAEYEVVK